VIWTLVAGHGSVRRGVAARSRETVRVL